ncbi:MAG: hypothetical protein V4649_08260 [Bacteroidota bacterium]
MLVVGGDANNGEKGFLVSIDKKLGNERFMANAKPDVVDAERKKQSDALAKIQTLEESLGLLSKS